jgi:hypothetical protein
MEMKETKQQCIHIFNFLLGQDCQYWEFYLCLGELCVYLHVKLLGMEIKDLWV